MTPSLEKSSFNSSFHERPTLARDEDNSKTYEEIIFRLTNKNNTENTETAQNVDATKS